MDQGCRAICKTLSIANRRNVRASLAIQSSSKRTVTLYFYTTCNTVRVEEDCDVSNMTDFDRISVRTDCEIEGGHTSFIFYGLCRLHYQPAALGKRQER